MSPVFTLPHLQIKPSIYISIHLSLSFSLSPFLSKAVCRVGDDYYVNECIWRERRRDGGVRHTAWGVLLFLFSLSRSIFPGSLLSPHWRNILISVTATNTLSVFLPHIYPPIHHIQSSILHPSLCPYLCLQWKIKRQQRWKKKLLCGRNSQVEKCREGEK